MKKLLDVKNLETSFFSKHGEFKAVRGVDFYINEGETFGIVGESGCGKSITIKSILNLIQSPGKIKNGEVLFEEKDILKLSQKELMKIRGNDISIIFQDPLSSLNPVYTIGSKMIEIIRRHNNISKYEAREKAIELLGLVGIPLPEKRIDSYPHEFSGGMRQRVMIAMSISCNPKLIIADEPTTALDVTIQAQILKLLKSLQKDTKTAIILITHDLGVVAQMCSRVAVMHSGIIVEEGTAEDIFYRPKHQYTKSLINAFPSEDSISKNKDIIYTSNEICNDIASEDSCPFADRCSISKEICFKKKPEFYYISHTHKVRCFEYEQGIKIENTI